MKTSEILLTATGNLSAFARLPIGEGPLQTVEFESPEVRDRATACARACHGLDLPADVPPGILADLVTAARNLEKQNHFLYAAENPAMAEKGFTNPAGAAMREILAKLAPEIQAPVSGWSFDLDGETLDRLESENSGYVVATLDDELGEAYLQDGVWYWVRSAEAVQDVKAWHLLPELP